MSQELDKLIEEAADALTAAGASEVYLFGSAASGRLRGHADIDLAVSGLPRERFFRAMGEAWDIVGRPVDLVDLDLSNPFTRYLKKSGELRRVR